jgi:ABC-type bacteriocin/lantibiotic exporter with double-glycine peptidase domain
VPVLASAALFVVGAHQHSQGALSAGGFVAFSSTFTVFLVAVSTLVGAVVDLSGARAEAERAAPLLAATPEVRTGATHPGVLQGDLRLEKVEFRYRADAPPVLDGLSLHVAPGELVAVVGASGCGKSTLLRLLLGFEAPQQGRIFYDGQDLSGLDLEAVRRQLGVVLQNGRISAGTVHQAVAGAHHATATEVWDALEAVALRTDVEAFPMGLHTQVGDGGSLLSGGQRQRLLIARALLARPRILLFDEATSALDNRAQATVSANLARLKVTRIVIAHRLSTIQDADRILVLVDGKVAQAGTYAELVDVDGPFRALVARQRK